MQPPKSGVDGEGLQVIHVALYRMATRSLAEAYRILGYKTHHGIEDILGNPWVGIEKAVEGTWPSIPNARPQARFTRQDWDELWGNEYDVITDLACPFTDQLIEAYPEAKIVVVQRDFESWWRSYQAAVLDNIFPASQWLTANARRTYDEYYRSIRETIPAERRLEYTMGDGWEPLCAFLGKEVPDMPFPRLNDSAYRKQNQKDGEYAVFLTSAKKMAVMGLGVGAIGTALWHLRT
ncbi:hypothetical protein NLG97_g7073 [Lecanicillium saksenae]|uniref:Uncharacterized protein n=1 Tax=Lecanicillium saksenae TaxID=468837 RepID=A0ACC1QRN6_9HYPO|nr:hypothetical protein NLG97_g7073 [Lecanicillium saksenae]